MLKISNKKVNIIDIHTHVLSGMDDGCPDIIDSIEILREFVSQNISTICATPHYYADRENPSSFLGRRDISLNYLKEAYENERGTIHMLAGAEVMYYNGICNTKHLHDLAIMGTNILLLEMPFTPWTSHIVQEVKYIYPNQGVIPLIAHIDRHLIFQNNTYIKELVNDPNIYIQANASFFTNKFTLNKALRMLSSGQIHLLGSDCHNMKNRKPNLKEAVANIYRKFGEDAFIAINTLENKLLKQASIIKLGV